MLLFDGIDGRLTGLGVRVDANERRLADVRRANEALRAMVTALEAESADDEVADSRHVFAKPGADE